MPVNKIVTLPLPVNTVTILPLNQILHLNIIDIMTHPLLAQEMLNWACLWVAIAICQNVKYDLIIFIWKLWCSYCYFIKRETSPFKVSVVEFSLFRTMTNYLHLWGSISIWNWRKLNCPWRDGTGEWQNSKVGRMVG